MAWKIASVGKRPAMSARPARTAVGQARRQVGGDGPDVFRKQAVQQQIFLIRIAEAMQRDDVEHAGAEAFLDSVRELFRRAGRRTTTVL